MVRGSDRRLMLGYVGAAALLLHLLILPLWISWILRPIDRPPSTPLTPNCTDQSSSSTPTLRPSTHPLKCPSRVESNDFQLHVIEETTAPKEKPKEPPPPEKYVLAPAYPIEESTPKEAAFSSTVDTQTDRETIAKSNELGDGGGPKKAANRPNPVRKKSSTPKKSSPPPKGLPTFEELLAKESTTDALPEADMGVPSKPSLLSESPPSAGQDSPKAPTLPEIAHWTPTLSTPESAASAASGGSIDYLNGIEEGDKTLLNRKRSAYASFFNRIQLAIKHRWSPWSVYRRRDPSGKIYGVGEHVTVLNVTLEGDGSIANLSIRKTSGLPFLDDEALRATRAAAPFPNPPEGLKDLQGNISFSFGFHFEVSTRKTRIFRFR